jgi:hypothetical protein
MKKSISEIIKADIELDGLLIEEYLIEQQNKSSDSPAFFLDGQEYNTRTTVVNEMVLV